MAMGGHVESSTSLWYGGPAGRPWPEDVGSGPVPSQQLLASGSRGVRGPLSRSRGVRGQADLGAALGLAGSVPQANTVSTRLLPREF